LTWSISFDAPPCPVSYQMIGCIGGNWKTRCSAQWHVATYWLGQNLPRSSDPPLPSTLATICLMYARELKGLGTVFGSVISWFCDLGQVILTFILDLKKIY
jgi:hypothetical protein